MKVLLFLAITVSLCFAAHDEPEIRALNFVKGLLEGIHEKKTVEDLQKCLKNVDPVIEKIEKGLELILKMTFPDIMAGLKLIQEGFHQLHEMLEPCIDGFKQLKKLLAALKDLNIMRIVIKIMQHKTELIIDIIKCVEAFKRLDLYTAGKCIGDILHKLFLAEARVLRFGIMDLALIVKGFLAGINQSNTIDDVEACIGKVPEIVDKIELIIELLKKLNWKSLDKLIEASKTILHVFEDILDSIKPCSKTPEEIDALLKKISEINTDKLLNRLMANSFKIINDITEAIKSISKKEYYEIGFRVADILYVILIKPNQP